MSRMKKQILLVVTSLVLLVPAAQAQKEAPLTLAEATTIALNSNPTVMIANMEVERVEYVLKESKSALIPTIKADLSYNHNISLPVMFMPEGVFGPGSGGATRMGFKNGFNGSVSASTPLYMPTIYRSIALSKEQLALAVESARASKINMVYEVENSYYAILLAEASLKVLLQNKELMQATVTDVENKFKQGVVSEYDLLTAQVQLQNVLPLIESARASLKRANYMIKVLLSLPQEIHILLTDKFVDISNKSTFAHESGNIDLSSNSDLRVMEHNINMWEHQYKLSRANRIPTIFASISLTSQTQSDDLNFSKFQWSESSVLGVGVSIPIFAGLKNNHKDSQIKNSIKQSKLQMQYMSDNLTAQANSIIDDVVSAREQILTNTEAVKLAKKANEISATRFKVGAGTILELNSSQMALIQAELSLNQSIYSLLAAFSSYDKLMGSEVNQ